MPTELRSKFGYLDYDDMIVKLDEGVFDAYDIIFSKDRKTQYIINPENKPIEVISRIKVFETTEQAVSGINEATDTYEGQIIAVKDSTKYRGYIVNKNIHNYYTISPLYENPDAINYDDLGNIPITNLRGEVSSPIVLSELSNGIYKIEGFFITPDEPSDVKNTVVGNLILVEGNYIKRITNKEICDYITVSGGVVVEKYATEDYIQELNYVTHNELESYGYVSDSEVDAKLTALESALREELIDYMEETFESKISSIVDAKFEQSQIPSEYINSLFP